MQGLQPKDLAILIGLTVYAGCATEPQQRRAVPSYDRVSGRLIQLTADQNGDGRTDQWTYLAGTRPIRGEADTDGDGRIDRWEYFGPAGELARVGTSSSNDGIEDTWTWTAPVNGEGRVDVASLRDRRPDRHEYYSGDQLTRVELDTNGDGRVDRWDVYADRVLREVRFDTSFASARPDRRLLYDAAGQYLAAEADEDGDGRFERVVPGRASAPTGGK